MEEYLAKVLSVLFVLYAGVMSWLFKMAWGELRELKKDHQDLKDRVLVLKGEMGSDFNKMLEDKFDSFFGQLDGRFEAWWSRIECNLMNEGRLPPKTRKTNKGDTP